jgi:hypothetical protein
MTPSPDNLPPKSREAHSQHNVNHPSPGSSSFITDESPQPVQPLPKQSRFKSESQQQLLGKQHGSHKNLSARSGDINQPKSRVSIGGSQAQFLAADLQKTQDLSFTSHTKIIDQSPIKGLTSPTKQDQYLGYSLNPEPSPRIVDGSFKSGSDPYQSPIQPPPTEPLPPPKTPPKPLPPTQPPANPYQDPPNPAPSQPKKRPQRQYPKDPHWGNLTGKKSSSEEYSGSSSVTDKTSKSLTSGEEVTRHRGQFRKKNIPNMDGMGMNPMTDPRMAGNPFVGGGVGMMERAGYGQSGV